MNKRAKILLAILVVLVAGGGFWWWRESRAPDPSKIGPAVLKSAERRLGAPPPVIHDAPRFTGYLDQNGKPTASEKLKGHIWIADFIFTNCGGTCPTMTAKMVQLQKDIPEPNVRFVSFSVDPQRDDPPALKAYAGKFGVDESRWTFLRPPDQNTIMKLAQDMRIVGPPKETNNPILHADRFILIDGAGKVRGTYFGGDDSAMLQLMNDARRLARGE